MLVLHLDNARVAGRTCRLSFVYWLVMALLLHGSQKTVTTTHLRDFKLANAVCIEVMADSF